LVNQQILLALELKQYFLWFIGYLPNNISAIFVYTRIKFGNSVVIAVITLPITPVHHQESTAAVLLPLEKYTGEQTCW